MSQCDSFCVRSGNFHTQLRFTGYLKINGINVHRSWSQIKIVSIPRTPLLAILSCISGQFVSHFLPLGLKAPGAAGRSLHGSMIHQYVFIAPTLTKFEHFMFLIYHHLGLWYFFFYSEDFRKVTS